MARSKPEPERHALALKPSTVESDELGGEWCRQHLRLCPWAFAVAPFAVEVGRSILAVFARVGLFLSIPFSLYLKLRKRKLFLR